METLENERNLEKKLLDDPSASFWLKEQIQTTRKRDIGDAMGDAEALLMVLHARWNKITKQK
jgi:hypothetical protein